MKWTDRIMSELTKLVLVLLIILSPFATISSLAEESISTNRGNWLENSAYYCLRASGLDMNEEFYLSDAFLIQSEETRCVSLYFVFCDGKCVGEILANDQTESCAYFATNCEAITDIYENGIEILVVSSDNNHIYAVRADNGNTICLYGLSEEKQAMGISHTGSSEITLRSIVEPCDADEGENRSVIDESCYLSVPKHGNPLSPDTNTTMCWLSCVLSIVEYTQGATTYTPRSLYDYLKVVYNPGDNGYPEGSQTWILRAFALFSYSVTYNNSGLMFNSVKNVIDTNKPVFAGIHDTSGIHGHAVVVCGYSRFSHEGLIFYYSYQLMDPNVPNYVTVTASGSSSSFTYGIYSLWTSYYY